MLLKQTPPWPRLGFARPRSPKVSIIIPVFNQYRHTYHCLAALLAHTDGPSFEVIVVDDASTDETAREVSAMAGVQLIRNVRNLGFVGACNGGATAAQGALLVFLNNDTQVQPGWLGALVETFERHPDAGIVGSRLIDGNGRQQEAGGIVFADGTCWHYGHLDAPERPEYCYLREPDYVSGAALAIRRDLFEQLGGFDVRFAPGYYEDVDLAFRVRAAGRRVIYQPRSMVVHLEGMSAGRDEQTNTGMKRFQAVNRSHFVARWQAALAAHGARDPDAPLNLERQKERQIRRRALVVDVYMLTPDRESGSLRMVNLFAILQSLGYKVTFAAANLEAPEPYLSDLQQQGVEVLYRPFVRSIAEHLRRCGALYDLVLASRADAAARVLGDARRWCPRAQIVYDTVDLHFLRELRLAALSGSPAVGRLAERRRRDELALVAAADTTLVVSTVERDLLAREAPDADVRVVSNVHRIPGRRAPFAPRSGMLFIGAFAHPPNVDALIWFCHEILPLVLVREPSLMLSVIGSDPPTAVRALASEQVHILGYVPDIAPCFDACRLSVAPLRYGAGVKGKINQSLAFGVPVVGTTTAVEGMFLVDGESVLVADSPAAFADAILRLYRDAELWQRLSDAGLVVMQTHFSFAAARRALEDLLGE